MPQPTGGKVNASNLNVDGLDEVAAPVATDVVILGRPGEQNTKAPLSSLPFTVPDPLLIANGAVATPSLAFTSDLDTGIFRPAANQFAVTAGGVQVFNAVLSGASPQLIVPQVNNASLPAIAFGDGDTGFFEQANGQLSVTIDGIRRSFWTLQGQFGNQSTSWALADVNASATVPTLIVARNDLDTGLGQRAADVVSVIAGGVNIADFSEVAGVAQLIVPFQNNPATPSIAFGDGDTGFRESADDTLQISIGGLSHVLISSTWIFRAILSNGPGMRAVDSTATVPNVHPNRDDTDTGLGTNGADVGVLIAGGVNVQEWGEAGAAPLLGFFGTAAVAQPTGVAVTAAGIHAALVTLGLITA